MPAPATPSQQPYDRKSLWACLPATTRGQPVLLDAHPRENKVLYVNGRTVVIRDLADPRIASEYTQHSAPCTVARYAPSGYYACSADERGNVRVWDTLGTEQVLKAEYQVLSGRVTDLAWDAESKRIIAVGDGRDKFAHAFVMDTGASCGDMGGHNKAVNAVSLKPTRPFRCVTAGDDLAVNFYHGVPYKFVHSHADHSRFVMAARYAPSGSHFVTTGLDGKVIVWEGATGEKTRHLATGIDGANDGHRGGVLAASWSPDSKRILTSSADGTVKLWDAEQAKCITTWAIGSGVEHQQLGNLWAREWLVSVSLNGELNYLDPASQKVTRTVTGHQRGVTALCKSGKQWITASYDGRICHWDDATARPTVGDGHTTQINELVLGEGGKSVYTAAMDDTSRTLSLETATVSASAKLPAQPTSMATYKGTRYVATVQGLAVVKPDGSSALVPEIASASVVCVGGDYLAVGHDKKVAVYALPGLTKKWEAEPAKGAVSCMAFTPGDAARLAVGDANAKIHVVDSTTGAVVLHQWVFHTARVTSVAWSPDAQYAVSGGIDCSVIVWSVERPMKHVIMRSTHTDSVSAVAWGGAQNEVVSAGADGCIKTWTVNQMP